MDDLAAITQLKARYFRLMDTKDWSGVEALFTDDACIDMTGEGSPAVQDRSEFVQSLASMLADVTTVHHGHMPEIEITGAATATGTWAMEDMLWWPEGAPLKHLHGYGHYHETYRRGQGRALNGWQIASMRLTRLRRDIEPAAPRDGG